MDRVEITSSQIATLAEQICKLTNASSGDVEFLFGDNSKSPYGFIFRDGNGNAIKMRYYYNDCVLLVALQPKQSSTIERKVTNHFHKCYMFGGILKYLDPNFRSFKKALNHIIKLAKEDAKSDTSKVEEVDKALDKMFPDIAEEHLLDNK